MAVVPSRTASVSSEQQHLQLGRGIAAALLCLQPRKQEILAASMSMYVRTIAH
jgi:hypothetical protein